MLYHTCFGICTQLGAVKYCPPPLFFIYRKLRQCKSFKENAKHSLNRLWENILSHRYHNIIFCLSCHIRNHASFDGLTVNGNGLDAFFHIIRIDNFDMIDSFPEFSCEFKIAESCGNAWIDAQTRMGRVYAQNILGNVDRRALRM